MRMETETSGPHPSFPIRRRTIVNALTPEVEGKCATLVKTLKDIPDRQRCAEELERRLESVSSETRVLIDYMVRKEKDHKLYVNSLLRQIPEFVAEGRRPHDFSKDLLFCFVTSLRFDCGIDTEDVMKLTTTEILNHHRQESHHPEWETHHNRECTRMDILEMAIDRLSRNVQRNDGNLNEKQMFQYLPIFPLGDYEKKRRIYLDYVKRYTSMVMEAYVPRLDE